MTRFEPKCQQSIHQGMPHPYHALWSIKRHLWSSWAPQKVRFGYRTGPNIVFWLLSPVGWGHMGQNGAVRSGHTVALLWTPHMPIFRRKFYGPPKGPPGAKTSPSGGPGVPVEVPEHMTSMLPTQLDQSVTVGTKLGLWGLLRTSRALRGPLGPPKGLFGPLGVLIWPQGGPK